MKVIDINAYNLVLDINWLCKTDTDINYHDIFIIIKDNKLLCKIQYCNTNVSINYYYTVEEEYEYLDENKYKKLIINSLYMNNILILNSFYLNY